MGLTGSLQGGKGSVQTTGRGGGDGGGGGGSARGAITKFSAVCGSTDDPTSVYMDDAGSVGGGSASPVYYPTSARTITVLNLSAPAGTSSNPPTATLYKNGVATQLTCTLPAGAPAGTVVSDDTAAHAVSFDDGDTFDVRLDMDAGGEGPAMFSASIEGPGGAAQSSGGGGGTGSGAILVNLLADSQITLSGVQVIDGGNATVGKIVCANGQTDPTENGLYTVDAGAWSRLTSFSLAAQMLAGTLVSITEGNTYTDSLWMFATPAPIVVGATDLSFAFIGPSFGPDTLVPLPNSAGTLVTALRVLTQLPGNTPGAETSTLTIQTLLAGVLATALGLNRNVISTPDGIYFLSDNDTGIQRFGSDNYGHIIGNQTIGVWTAAGLTLAAALGANLTWGAGAGFVAYDSVTGHLTLAPASTQGNVRLGLAALTNVSTHGFPLIPAGAGVPTGVVTVPAGFAALWLNTTTSKLYATTGGGTWVDVSGA